MHVSLAQPNSHIHPVSRPETSFSFTVPHAEPAAPSPQPEPAWQGITAGWLAGGDGVVG